MIRAAASRRQKSVCVVIVPDNAPHPHVAQHACSSPHGPFIEDVRLQPHPPGEKHQRREEKLHKKEVQREPQRPCHPLPAAPPNA